jgi:hypothetical protein
MQRAPLSITMEMMIDEPLLIAGAVMLLKQIERTNGGDQTGESKLHRMNMFGADSAWHVEV